jgi:DNA invertase Pin-like site-specific DNA recombinase
MPEADRTFLQMVSVFAEWEARKISERTKAALQAAKARGKRLGWSMPSRVREQAAAADKGAAANVKRADQFAENVLPVISSIRASGASTLAEVAVALNNRGIRTARGGQWYPMTVCNIERRGPTRSKPEQSYGAPSPR